MLNLSFLIHEIESNSSNIKLIYSGIPGSFIKRENIFKVNNYMKASEPK